MLNVDRHWMWPAALGAMPSFWPSRVLPWMPSIYPRRGCSGHRTVRAKWGSTLNWLCQDLLEAPRIPRNDYALIILFRFVAPDLLPTLKTHLVPGGVLLVEEHLRVSHGRQHLAGPGSDRFRVGADELRRAADGLTLLYHYAGITRDPDGRYVALTRLLARAPE